MLKGKDLLSIHDLSLDEFHEILALAKELKAMQKAGVQHHILEGKTLGMIFEKSSTSSTRSSRSPRSSRPCRRRACSTTSSRARRSA